MPHSHNNKLNIISPQWPAPVRVRAASTTRLGGCSTAPFAALNLAHHVGDDPQAVSNNRSCLQLALDLPGEPLWLDQVHGTQVVSATNSHGETADGCWTDQAGVVCAVMTADCLPLLLCDRAGTVVAAVHAGWRGLQAGVIEAGVKRLNRPASEILVWLGPAIGPDVFEVGDEVYHAFVNHDSDAQAAFRATREGHWLADIYLLARQRLSRLGIESVYGGDHCTLSESEQFFSYRRDGETGRMASLIWLQD